ncbi:MAG: hypothetical protein ACJ786_07080 [Catenulispora sp.]
MDDLHRRLRAAADAHQPDRDAILARLQQGMADSSGSARHRAFRRRRRASWIKISLAGVAGVGVLGVGGLAVAVGVQQQQAPPHPAPPAVTPTAGNAVAATPKPRPSATGSTAPTSPPSSAAPSTTASRHTPEPSSTTSDGPITARGSINPKSNVYWAQSDLTIDLAQQLTTLTVEIRIAQTDGVQNTGNWRTEPADEFTVSVAPADGFLVYRWTLKPGRAVPAAQEVFAAQYNHVTGKRDASKDTFRVETTVAGHTSVVRGNFPAGN